MNIDIIEITGSFGKTSTSFLLSWILSSKKNIAISTTSGIIIWKNKKLKVISSKNSITPSKILENIDLILFEDKDIELICIEISLGFIGIGTTGIITSLTPEYYISGHQMSSINAKLRIFKSNNYNFKEIIVNKKDENKIYKKLNNKINCDIISYDSSSLSIIKNETKVIFSINKLQFYYKLKNNFIIKSYTIPIIISLLFCIRKKIPFKIIKNRIELFDGAIGRMNIKRYNENHLYIDNSNSGTNKNNTIFVMNHIIQNYNNKKIILIIGEEEKNICEGFPLNDIIYIINKYILNIEKLIIISKKTIPNIKNKNIYYAESLEKSFNIVKKIIK